ncbi:MAG: c-type cytochrome [Anaerolineales bacterium]
MKRLAAAIGVGLFLTGCSLAGDVTPPAGWTPAPRLEAGAVNVEWPAQPPDAVAGALVYADRCAPCHGPSGRGDGPDASSLPVPPAPLADTELARAAAPVDWYRIVTAGNLDRFMPPFSSLSVQERWNVVAYALSLSESPDVAQGGAVYRAMCADCHGEGDSPVDLPPAMDLAAQPLGEIEQSIRSGVAPGMPAFGTRLTAEEIWLAAAYLRDLSLVSLPVAVQASLPATREVNVRGEVRNGTADAPTEAGEEVTIRAFQQGRLEWTVASEVGPAAEFALQGVPADAGWVLVASVEHDGVVYLSEAVMVVGDESSVDLPVTVYETTEDASSARIDQLHLLFDFPAPGVVKVIEVLSLANMSDRTLVPGVDGVSLSVPLPEGIFRLEWEDPNADGSFRKTPDGFDVLLPIRPGSAAGTFVFQFELPYNRGAVIRQPLARPMGGGLALVPVGGPLVVGEGVEPQGVRDVQGTQVEVYTIGPRREGEYLTLALAGAVPGFGPNPWALGIGAAAMVGALALARSWLRNQGSEASHD